MTKYSAKLDPTIRASLGDLRSDFVEQAFVRFVHLKDALQNDQHPAQIRLLLLKEIFSIFDEIHAVYDIKANFSNPESFEGIFELIVFARNVLLHFPIFDTWDQINISPEMGSEMTRERKGGQIAKYLNNKFGKDDIPFELNYERGNAKGSIKLSAIKANPEKTFLKSIVSEDNVILLLTELLQFLYTAKK